MTLHELKQAQLAKRLELLVAQYEAASRQRNQTLNAADKVTLDEQLRQFEQDIAAVERELAALESGAPVDATAQEDRRPSTRAAGRPLVETPTPAGISSAATRSPSTWSWGNRAVHSSLTAERRSKAISSS